MEEKAMPQRLNTVEKGETWRLHGSEDWADIRRPWLGPVWDFYQGPCQHPWSSCSWGLCCYLLLKFPPKVMSLSVV